MYWMIIVPTGTNFTYNVHVQKLWVNADQTSVTSVKIQ